MTKTNYVKINITENENKWLSDISDSLSALEAKLINIGVTNTKFNDNLKDVLIGINKILYGDLIK